MRFACEGPKGEGGLDDATGAGGTGASSMKQTSGAVNLGTRCCMLRLHISEQGALACRDIEDSGYQKGALPQMYEGSDVRWRRGCQAR